MYEVGFWVNMGEAVTSILIDGSATVILGEDKNTIYINDVLVDLGETVSYIKYVE